MGFPIRTSTDRGLVDGSPWLFAVTHVLHRFLAPRHSPLALCSLERTRFISRSGRSEDLLQYGTTEGRPIRCSCLLCSSQGATPTSGCVELESSRPLAVAERDDSLKTEEKTVAHVARTTRRDRIPATHGRDDENPPVHQLGCVSNRVEQMSTSG